MNLLEMIAKPIQSVKEALDLDPPTLTDQLVRIKKQLAEVQERLDESRAIEREKDALILQLKDAMKTKGDMVMEGDAYFAMEEGKVVDGPFCTCCADRDQQYIHLIGATKPEGRTGRQMDWVQCPQCRTPFCSKQAGEYLKTHKLPSTGSQADKPQSEAKAASSAAPKRSAQAASRKSTSAQAGAKKKQARSKSKTTAKTPTTKKTSTAKSKSRSKAR